ncbi:MAG: hypothetical protein AUK50_04735 [Comamonadaceae bacterium CG2_30_57_122]|nr:MAG: hypothetical protein AUK50_04735 [Comamonadaceae bacterium CG2_30_57_122]
MRLQIRQKLSSLEPNLATPLFENASMPKVRLRTTRLQASFNDMVEVTKWVKQKDGNWLFKRSHWTLWW